MFLHHFGQAIRDLFALIPLAAVRVLFVATLIGVLAWVLTLPRQATCPADRPADRPAAWSENLKIWAALALLIQIAIYALI
jgi:hypothetical protein